MTNSSIVAYKHLEILEQNKVKNNFSRDLKSHDMIRRVNLGIAIAVLLEIDCQVPKIHWNILAIEDWQVRQILTLGSSVCETQFLWN